MMVSPALGKRADARPAVLPEHGGDLQKWATGRAVVGMEDEVILARFLKDGLMAGAAPVRRGGGDDQRSAVFGERLAVLIEVGPGDLAGAAHHYVVSTLDAATAEIVGDEEIPPVIVPDDERS